MLKLRNVAAVALVLGIVAGVWLGDFWRGFGKGPGPGGGDGGVKVQSTGDTRTVSHLSETPAAATGESLRVMIRDRSYFLKTGGEEQRISLEDLVQAVQNTPGDDDGLRLRVSHADDARVTADVQLREALQAAEVPDSAVFWTDATP